MNLFGQPFYISRTTMFYMALVLFAMFILFAPGHAFAGSLPGAAGGDLPYEDAINSLVKSLQGPVALVLSVGGIVIAGGILIFGGDISGFFKTLIFLILVISVIVNASSLITMITGKGAEIAQIHTDVAMQKFASINNQKLI